MILVRDLYFFQMAVNTDLEKALHKGQVNYFDRKYKYEN